MKDDTNSLNLFPMSVEFRGAVKRLIPDLGCGFISCDIGDVYFKIYNLQNSVSEQDKVAFLLKEKDGKRSAVAIRRIFENIAGVQFIQRIDRHHIHDGVEAFIPDVINRLSNLGDDHVVQELNFSYDIGYSTCVPTNEKDEIVYGIRGSRIGHSRLVLNRTPVPCSSITMALLKASDHFIILSAYVGTKAEVEPFDPRATESSLTFWRNYALIYDPEEIVEGSLTRLCPWVLGKPALSRYPKRS